MLRADVAWFGVCVLCGPLACAPSEPRDRPAPAVEVIGDGDGARLLSMQVSAQAADYASGERFDALLRPLFERARDDELLNARTVVVLPEYIGTWLVALDEGAGVVDADTIQGAMTQLALAHLPQFVFTSWNAPADVKDHDAFAAFTIKSERMAQAYDDTMRALADDFDVTLVAGSILLPDARIVDGALAVSPGAALENVSAVYDADGALLALSKKARPTADELPFVKRASFDDVAVVDTAAGRLGVAVCADSFFPETYARLEEEHVELLAVPTFHSGDWHGTWHGYSGADEPDDVDADDIGDIEERDAWDRYSLVARAPAAKIRGAVTAPLRGSLWDLHDDGQALLVDDAGAAHRMARKDRPGLFELRLSSSAGSAR